MGLGGGGSFKSPSEFITDPWCAAKIFSRLLSGSHELTELPSFLIQYFKLNDLLSDNHEVSLR